MKSTASSDQDTKLQPQASWAILTSLALAMTCNSSPNGIAFPLTDSKHSLDPTLRARESAGMIAQRYELYIERRDAARNMARFYVLSIRPTLFGEVQLTRRWGRIGARGQAMSHSFARENDAVRLFLDLLRLKRKRGYGPKGRAAANSQK